MSMSDPERERWFIQEVLPSEAGLRSYLKRFFSEASDIDDAVQEAYARLIVLNAEERGRIRSTHSFLFTAARNVALDRLRRQRIVSLETVAELDALQVVDERPAAEEEVNGRQELALLSRVLDALPERCRQIMKLRKVFGLSQKEIAARLSITENTVETQVANGMRLCAARIYALTQGGPEGAATQGTSNRKQNHVE